MGVFQALRRLGAGYAVVATTDQIQCDATSMTITPTGGTSLALATAVQAASKTAVGRLRFAQTSEAQSATALLALDAPTLTAAMSAIMTAWLATLPTTPQTPGSGTWWNNAGVPTQA